MKQAISLVKRIALIMILLSPFFLPKESYGNNENLFERPDSTGIKTEVTIGIYVVDIEYIDNLKQNFTADFLLTAQWKDKRLSGEKRKINIEKIWSPNINILNGRNLSTMYPENVDVDEDGNVMYRQRYYGNLTCLLDLKNFPFDDQVLPISLVTLGYRPEQIELIFQDDNSGSAPRFSNSDWEIGKGVGSIGEYIASSSGKNSIEYILPAAHFKFEAKRHIFYYIWKVVLPLFIIVLMSWAIFYIDPTMVAPQLGLAATSILTLIAFLFSLGRILPPIAYLTKIDYFVYGSLSLVFLAFGEAVLTIHLGSNGKIENAKWMDRKARIIFPLAYLLILITFFIV